MAQTLLAIVLITNSARGANIVFRWPPFPQASPRLCRPKPDNHVFISQIDNPWRASGFSLTHDPSEHDPPAQDDRDYGTDPEYAWKRPWLQCTNFKDENSPIAQDYNSLFGYTTEFLASLLIPPSNQCHQKFQLIVDDLAFIGHPVSADEDEVWGFKPEKFKPGARGRDSKDPNNHPPNLLGPKDDNSLGPEPSSEKASTPSSGKKTGMQQFQLAFVLDLPDPSSSASGNVLKYFDIIYEQIVFTFTAVLFQEQVLSGFVEAECEALTSIKERFALQGQPYDDFVRHAFQSSSIACAMKSVYDAIKTRSIAYVTINAIPIELQLPPHLDDLLHNDNEVNPDSLERPEDEDLQNWGPELSVGWRLPALVPWKSLLLMDGSDGLDDPTASLRGPHVSMEDRTLAEGLIRFLETAAITMTLAEMGGLLDWDLETQVYPVVRWLVHHRRAKVVDVVNPGLKTIFALPPKFSAPLSTLSKEFSQQFSHPAIAPLPRILSMISSSLAQQSNNHFFASVVKSKDLIRMYHDVVLWMLKRDLLVTLHLRIRIVATTEIKQHVYEKRQRKLARRRRRRRRPSHSHSHSRSALGSGSKLRGPSIASQSHGGHLELEHDDFDGLNDTNGHGNRMPSGIAWLSLLPKRPPLKAPSSSSRRRHQPRLSSADSRHSVISELIIPEDDDDERGSAYADERDRFDDGEEDEDVYEDEDDYFEDGLGSDETGGGTTGSESELDLMTASMINDPGRATPLQRRWLYAMSEGKDPYIAKRFELINQYFDGKRSDDEILFRAEISRRELREVLHAYEPYLQTFLHPS